jgi:acyl dehydratase
VVVNSGLTVAIVLGQSVTDISQTAVFNLGWEGIHLTHPVYVGDTLYAESIILSKRPSESRPYAGVIGCATRGLNQHGDECVSWKRSVLVYRLDAPHDKGYFPEARSGVMQLSDWADA